jgi:hypothetical protein
MKTLDLVANVFAEGDGVANDAGPEPRDLAITQGHSVGTNDLSVAAEREPLDAATMLMTLQVRDGDRRGRLIARIQAKYALAAETRTGDEPAR